MPPPAVGGAAREVEALGTAVGYTGHGGELQEHIQVADLMQSGGSHDHGDGSGAALAGFFVLGANLLRAPMKIQLCR